MEIAIDEAYLIQTLSDMISIDSVNPGLVPGGAGEGEMANYIEAALRDLGIPNERYDLETDRANVVGMIKGTGSGRSLMLNAHTDTVGYDGMENPLIPEIRDGKMFGRGAFDMKASLAASLAAFKALSDANVELAGDLVFAAVIDEEFKSLGTRDLLTHHVTDGAIITEPTGLRVCCGHRGFIWYDVETIGRAAHGSRYKEGIDANTKMGYFLVELDKLSRDLIQRPPHSLLGPPSMHVPLMNGGSSQSVYAAHCQIEIERRLIPGETHEQALGEIQAIIDKLSSNDPTFSASVEETFSREAFEVAPDAPIVKAVVQASEQVRGVTPEIYGELWWMDSGLTDAAGIETVIIGPTGGGAHADVEWVELDSVVELARILVQAAIDYCNTSR